MRRPRDGNPQVPPKHGPDQPFVTGPTIALDEGHRRPNTFHGRDSALPFTVGIHPSAVVTLTVDDVVSACRGDLGMCAVARAVEELPVPKNPVTLALQIVEVVLPRHTA